MCEPPRRQRGARTEPTTALRAGSSPVPQRTEAVTWSHLILSGVSHLSPQPKCDGQTLLTQVWKRLNLLEHDYFGLEFQNAPSYWVRASRLFLERGSGCAVDAHDTHGTQMSLRNYRSNGHVIAARAALRLCRGCTWLRLSPGHILPPPVCGTHAREVLRQLRSSLEGSRIRVVTRAGSDPAGLQTGCASFYLVDEALEVWSFNIFRWGCCTKTKTSPLVGKAGYASGHSCVVAASLVCHL